MSAAKSEVKKAQKALDEVKATDPKIDTDKDEFGRLLGDDGVASGADENFLQHLDSFSKYMLAKDPRQKGKIEAYRQVALYAAINGSVQITWGGQPRLVKGWALLRSLMKNDIYKTAMLRPTKSDPDAVDGSIKIKLDDEVDEASESEDSSSPDSFLRTADTFLDAPEDNGDVNSRPVHALAGFLRTQGPLKAPGATALPMMAAIHQNVMITLLTESQKHGGCWPDASTGRLTMVDKSYKELVTILPLSWDDALAFCDRVRAGKHENLLKTLHPFPEILATSLTSTEFRLFRTTVVLHLMLNVGQQFMMIKAETDDEASHKLGQPSPSQYLHGIALTMVRDLVYLVDLTGSATPDSQGLEKDSIVSTLMDPHSSPSPHHHNKILLT